MKFENHCSRKQSLRQGLKFWLHLRAQAQGSTSKRKEKTGKGGCKAVGCRAGCSVQMSLEGARQPSQQVLQGYLACACGISSPERFTAGPLLTLAFFWLRFMPLGFPGGASGKGPTCLHGEDPLEEATTTHSSVLAWRIPWIEEPGGLWSTGSQRVRHDWSDLACMQPWQVPHLYFLVTVFKPERGGVGADQEREKRKAQLSFNKKTWSWCLKTMRLENSVIEENRSDIVSQEKHSNWNVGGLNVRFCHRE